MGTRGRAPLPTQLKLLNGEKKDRINFREPIPRDYRPEAPEGMAQEVRDIWDYTLAELDAMKIVVAADRDALACYCEAVVAHRKASAILAKSPVLVKGQLGGLVRNPALAVQRDAAHTMRGFAQEFGLTPSARTRIQVDRGEVANANPFATAN